MTQKEFNKLTFSQRHEISKGTKCNASWQVRTIGGNLHAISCRNCGTVLQSDCTPKCLLHHPPLTDANTVLCGEGHNEEQSVQLTESDLITADKIFTPNAPNELLATEASEKGVSVGEIIFCKCGSHYQYEYKDYTACLECGRIISKK